MIPLNDHRVVASLSAITVPLQTAFGIQTHFEGYTAKKRFCANGHSGSTHWPAQWYPVRSPM